VLCRFKALSVHCINMWWFYMAPYWMFFM